MPLKEKYPKIHNKYDLRDSLANLQIQGKIMKFIFSSFEYDGQKNSVAKPEGFRKEWTNNIFLGVGTKIRLSEVTSATFELLYHVNYEPGASPYGFKQTLGRIGLVF
mgnify:CR=1 FL=1